MCKWLPQLAGFVLPEMLEKYKLMDKTPGSKPVDDAMLEKLVQAHALQEKRVDRSQGTGRPCQLEERETLGFEGRQGLENGAEQRAAGLLDCRSRRPHGRRGSG